MSLKEALRELGVDDTATPDEKMRAVFQWELGDASWWEDCKVWMAEAGLVPAGAGLPARLRACLQLFDIGDEG